MAFDNGGCLSPHVHESSHETIFCIDGEYYDPVNDVTLRRGDCQFLPMGKEHAGQSDSCLLLVLWEPPLPLVPLYEDEDG